MRPACCWCCCCCCGRCCGPRWRWQCRWPPPAAAAASSWPGPGSSSASSSSSPTWGCPAPWPSVFCWFLTIIRIIVKGETGILFSYRLCLKVIDSVCIKVSLITFHRIHYRIPVEIKRCRYCVKQKCFKTWVYKSYIYFNSLFYLPLLPQMNILNSNIEVNGGYHFDD